MTDPAACRVRDPAARAAFFAAYDRMLRRWPAGSRVLDLTSDFGTTRVRVTGSAAAPPLLLLRAYQASSAEWVALVSLLSDRRRIYAVDMTGVVARINYPRAAQLGNFRHISPKRGQLISAAVVDPRGYDPPRG